MNGRIFHAAMLVGVVVVLCGATTGADARGAKEFYSQDYKFDRPMRGYEGQAGSYYCSYQRLPNRICRVDSSGNERCKVQGWTLRQHCY